MVARTLEARLTLRILAAAGVVLVGVGAASVVVLDRVLDAADTADARGKAAAAHEALEEELDEGDGAREAIGEVLATAEAEGTPLAVVRPAQTASARGVALPALADGACATTRDERGALWRACAAASARSAVVAAVPIGGHRDATRALARGMAAVLLGSLLLVWWTVRRAVRVSLRDLSGLVGWTARIVDTEQAVDPPPTRTREIGQLQGAFDALVRRLLDALARERASSAHMAHELRTPLTAIAAELDGIDARDDATRAALARVRSDLARLADVIEAILVLSRNPKDAVGERAVINVADLAREHAPEGTAVQAPDEALVHADERLVALALRNLLDNAGKYGRGVALVSVTREGEAVRLAVTDRGPGLDEAARARMFDRYWRGSADGEGKGLGLALVRAVAERYGGRADARPTAQGEGLVVSLTFAALVGWHEEAAGPG